ncbi:MAG: hypothetical protein ACHREM_13520 [Polyangiales bacterium]
MSWSHPPHPVDVIPSFDPAHLKESSEHLVLYDFMHDADLRDYVGGDDVKKALGVQHVQDVDPLMLIQRYDASSLPNMASLNGVLEKAVKRRQKLGPLPVANYAGDPVVIYYYDTDKVKAIFYPKKSITSSAGGALDPKNLYWWKNNDVHTEERHDDGSWGDEGFDWDKDVAGNVGQIVSTLCSVVGTVLQVIPGIGTGVGTILMGLGPLIGSLLNVVDVAFQGGDLGKALDNLGTAILKIADSGKVPKTGSPISPKSLTELGKSMQTLGSILDAGQKQDKSFEDSWNVILAEPSKYASIDDNTIDFIGKSLGSEPADKILHAGYDASHYADGKTLGAIGLLFPDPGAGHLFMFGAGLGALAQAQKAPLATKRKSLVSHSIGRGLHAPISAASAKDDLLTYVQGKTS